MTHDLELERKKLDLKRCEINKDEIDFKVLERLDEIERLKKQKDRHDERIDELKKQIHGWGNK